MTVPLTGGKPPWRLTIVASALALGAACAGGGARSDGPPPLGASRRDDIVVIPQFTGITGIAVGARSVFILSPAGLAIYDRVFDRWLPPVLTEDLRWGSPLARPPVVMADPAADAVWIGIGGSLLTYEVAGDRLTRTSVPGEVEAIAFDRRDPAAGAVLETTVGWFRATAGGIVRPMFPGEAPPAGALARPATWEELRREFPALAALGRLTTRDEALGTYDVSAAARDPDRSIVWLGTWGNGAFRVDPNFGDAQHVPFGLTGGSAAAIAPAPGGVWVASDRRRAPSDRQPDRGGVTFVGDDLQQWRWITDRRMGLDRVRVYDLLVRDDAAWLATDRGVLRLGLEEDAMRRLRAVAGIAASAAFSLTSRGNEVWAGTERGASRVDRAGDPADESGGSTVAAGIPVYDLLFAGDTLWLGSERGLLVRPAGAESTIPLDRLLPRRRLDVRIRRLAATDSILYVLTDRELIEVARGGDSLSATVTTIAIDAIGHPAALAADERTIWLGGSAGLLIVDRGSGVRRLLRGGGELPGSVRDIALHRELAWIATDRGLVRMRRLGDGSIR